MESNDFWCGRLVRLRALTPEDADWLSVQFTDSAAARLGDDIKLPVSTTTLREQIEKQSKRTDHGVWLAVEALDGGTAVGTVDAHDVDQRHRNFKYGVSIIREQWRKGYATEAIALLLRYYFRELGYHRATGIVYAFNEASIELHRHGGFVEEGRLRENLHTNGGYSDEIVFGMLRSEFETSLERQLPRNS